MTANDTDDGHLTIDDGATAAMPASNRTVTENVSIVCVMQIVHLTVSCSIQCCHVDSAHAPHVIPACKKGKKKQTKTHELENEFFMSRFAYE